MIYGTKSLNLKSTLQFQGIKMILIIDHPVWVALQQHLLKNFPEYLTLGSALSIAWVCTWPEKIPASSQEWWAWFRDTFQTAIPAARAQRQAVPPTPPKEDK